MADLAAVGVKAYSNGALAKFELAPNDSSGHSHRLPSEEAKASRSR